MEEEQILKDITTIQVRTNLIAIKNRRSENQAWTQETILMIDQVGDTGLILTETAKIRERKS